MTADARLLPFDTDAEAAVLGACLVDNTAFARVATLLRPEDFFRAENRLVWSAMQAVASRAQPTDPILVANELLSRGEAQPSGGVVYLTSLTVDLATSVGCEFYAQAVARDAIYRRLASAAQRIAQIAFDGGPNLEENLSAAQAHLTLVQRQLPGKGFRTVADLTASLRSDLEAGISGQPATRSIPTGLKALDRLLIGHGLPRGKTLVIGAHTSVGKSTFLRVVLRNIALTGRHVALFTLEQDEQEVLEELAYSLAGIDRGYYQRGDEPLDYPDREAFMDALDRLQELHTFHVDDQPGITAQDIRLRLSRLCNTYPVDVVGVDYLHILQTEARKGETREREISRTVELLRDTAKELDVTLLLMSQLNREGDRPERRGNEFRPTLRDFRDSGAVAHLPYAVIGLHRRDYWVEKGQLDAKRYRLGNETVAKNVPGAEPVYDGLMEAIVLKQQRGPTGRATLRFDGARAAVEDVPTP